MYLTLDGLCLVRQQEKTIVSIGPSPWSATPERAADGSSAALLAAGWLRIVPLDTPALKETLDFLSNVLHHNGGILSMGGAHIAKTGMWLALRKQFEPSVDAVSTLAKFASSTGALPAVRHKSKGALEEGILCFQPQFLCSWCLMIWL